MNIHHLELFYYVARYGGISAAVRQMPYGIQQPAISSQILLLEEDLGVRLFVRQPFKLTEQGQELLAFVRPFFDNLDAVGVRLRGRVAPQLRIGAAERVLRDHLPVVIQRLRRSHPEIRLGLRSAFQAELETWLQNREIDLAIIPLRGRLPAGWRRQHLLTLPLVLLVPRRSKIKNAAELWERSEITETLISLPETESISELFQRGLKRRGIKWTPKVEASSMELVTQYVANGEGIGVNIAMPDVVRHPLVRVLPLEGFEAVELAAVWQGKPTPVIQAVLEEIRRYLAENNLVTN
jgi:DNA-binding transcriptional LysR family regulator